MKHSLELTDKHPSLEVEPLLSTGVELFTETGDPTQLTIEEARNMELSTLLMSQVPGVTHIDIDEAIDRENNWNKERGVEMLQEFGLDDSKLDDVLNRGERAYIQNLVDITQILPDTQNRDKQDLDRGEIEKATQLLVDFVVENEMGVARLCRTVRLDSSDGVRDVQILKYVHNFIYDRFVALSHKDDLTESEQLVGENYSKKLNQFCEFAEQVVDTSWQPSSNYLTSAYMHNLAMELKFSEPTTLDNDELPLIEQMIGLERVADFNPDTLLPFWITDSNMALFGTDCNVLYILDEVRSDDFGEHFSDLENSIRYSVAGQYFARRVVANVPEELVHDTEIFYDTGDQVGSDTNTAFYDKNQLRDYLFMMRRAMRKTIESSYGIELKDLSLQEQIHFLNYLKKVSVADVETLQYFIQEHGVPAMRSFLALAESEGITGDDIVNFGNNLGDSARDVFGRYCEILDAVNEIDAWLSSRVTVSPEEYAELKKQIETSLMKNANQLLRSAIASGESEGIQKQLEACQAEARQEVALLQSVGIDKLVSKPLEQTPAIELAETDRARMRELVRDNYKNETPEFQALVAKSLEEHITDPNTDFYVLRNQNGLIISFNRFDKELDPETGELSRQYFGSFNADPIYFGVGSIMMERTIKDQLDKCPVLYAHCDPRAKISQKYIEDGFIGTQTVSPAGKFSFEIWRTKNSSEKLKTKQMSPEALVAIAGETVPADFDYFVREVEPNDQFLELDAAFPFLLTRYFTVGGQTYAAFELNTELSRQFEIPLEKEQPVVPVQRAV